MERPIIPSLTVCGLVLGALAAPLSAKERPTPDYLTQSLDAAGGAARFDRIETLRGTFRLVQPTTAGVVNSAVEFEAARGSGGWRVRERFGGSERVWTTTAPCDVAFAPVDERAARERFFLLLCSYHLNRAAAKSEYRGMGYLEGRLSRRLSVSIPGTEALWNVFVDTATSVLRGIGRAGSTDVWLFENEDLFQSQFILPTRWTRYSTEGRRMEIARLTDFLVNALLSPDFIVDAPSSTSSAPRGESP